MPLLASEKQTLKQYLHDINNALNVVSMQAELAGLYLEQGNVDLAQDALRVVMAECRGCSDLSQQLQRQFAAD